jgi:hypothetical protein
MSSKPVKTAFAAADSTPLDVTSATARRNRDVMPAQSAAPRGALGGHGHIGADEHGIAQEALPEPTEGKPRYRRHDVGRYHAVHQRLRPEPRE